MWNWTIFMLRFFSSRQEERPAGPGSLATSRLLAAGEELHQGHLRLPGPRPLHHPLRHHEELPSRPRRQLLHRPWPGRAGGPAVARPGFRVALLGSLGLPPPAELCQGARPRASDCTITKALNCLIIFRCFGTKWAGLCANCKQQDFMKHTTMFFMSCHPQKKVHEISFSRSEAGSSCWRLPADTRKALDAANHGTLQCLMMLLPKLFGVGEKKTFVSLRKARLRCCCWSIQANLCSSSKAHSHFLFCVIVFLWSFLWLLPLSEPKNGPRPAWCIQLKWNYY